jgi:transcriptional regulator with XRE-family HTH domain
MCALMARRPRYVTVGYRGIPHRLDLVICRHALVQCQVRGELDSMESLAVKVKVSRSTASRFFSGKPTSLAVTLKILDALHLKFEDVATPLLNEAAAPEPDAKRIEPADGPERNADPRSPLSSAAGVRARVPVRSAPPASNADHRSIVDGG